MKPEDGKGIYDSIEIPEELDQIVRQSIAEAEKRRREKETEEKESDKDRGGNVPEKSQEKRSAQAIRFSQRMAARFTAAAAGAAVVFTIGLNTNQAFAETMKQIPGIGFLAEVLTIRSYHQADQDYNIDAEIPAIVETGSPDGSGSQSGTAKSVNEQIEQIVDNYLAEGKKEFAAYKEAFFAAGGTEEEWADRQMDLSVDYQVKYQSEEVLSLELITFKGWVNAMEERYYYNLDLKQDRLLALKDVLGSGYVERCNKEVVRQIEARMAADENQMFFGFEPNDDGMAEGFTTVDETTQFYINENQEVVLVFPEYSIAPGYMGITEFNMGKAEFPS